MNNAIVIANGFVGKATAHALGIKDHFSRSSSTVTKEQIANFKYIFVCLPTPTLDGICDSTLILEYVKYISSFGKDNIFIIRSTVTPGTCDLIEHSYKVKVVHVPEFLTEDTWKDDTNRPDLVVIGGNDLTARSEVEAIFRSRYASSEFILADTWTTETIKYAINTFYALKVVFANQLYDYCQSNMLNYQTIMKAMYSRKWIGKNHLDVHHKGYRGAGGKCLEKDLEAFASHSRLDLLKVANKLNKEYLHGDPKTN